MKGALGTALLATLLTAAGLVATLPTGAGGGNQVPCSDTSPPTTGCPDLVVDPSTMRPIFQTRTFDANDCAVVEGMVEPGTRDLLRFTFTTPNFGTGDLIVGAPADHPEWFVYHDCHRHYHFREYADYRLWTLEAYAAWTQLRLSNPGVPSNQLLADHPELLDGFVAGNKQGFCVIDIRLYVPTMPANYRSCGSDQGISVGWADEYFWALDGQWVDITGVAPGAYMLEAEVNAEHLYVESDYANNAVAVPVNI